jgi:hypothetical protein
LKTWRSSISNNESHLSHQPEAEAEKNDLIHPMLPEAEKNVLFHLI